MEIAGSVAATSAAAPTRVVRSAYASPQPEPGPFRVLLIYAIILVGFAAVSFFQIEGVVLRLLRDTSQHHGLRAFLYPSLFWTGMGMLLFVLRTGLWIAYRPIPPADPDEAPLISVIIPAYNEGVMVLSAIESVAKANYPHDRIEILAIDDGSTDDTWAYIAEAAARYPSLVTGLRHTCNRGKREALAWGFRRARGTLFVTLDSDSVVEPDAFLALAAPFTNPRIGAVAGKVMAYNRDEGLIPQMLHVRFILAFDMLRSVESMFRTVYCCPGALTALRAAPVRAVLDRWERQTFLGRRCTFGEDRAMTNYLFEAGYDTVYQRSAVVHTLVPKGWTRMCKMLLRWERSGVREDIRFARILWRRPPGVRLIAGFDRLVINFRHVIYYATIVLLAWLGTNHPSMLVRTITAVVFVSLLNTLYFLRSERSWAFLYGVLFSCMSALTMFWIYPYAVLTVNARSWLTR